MILIYFKVVAETLVQLNTCSGSTPTWASQSVLYHCILYAFSWTLHTTYTYCSASPHTQCPSYIIVTVRLAVLCCAAGVQHG